ncbi:Periplasmic beta-glucosidase precursor [compost metagenome]
MNLKKIAIIGLLVLSSQATFAQKKKPTPVKPQLTAAQIETKVEDLLKQMTLEEKVGQMAQITLDVIGKGDNRFASFEPFALDDKMTDALVNYKIGSVLNTANNRARTPQVWKDIVSKIQDVAMKNRLKIPVLYGVDAIHGTTYTVGATMFPQQIAQAASRNRELVRRGAEITAYETRASSIPWTFSPVLDLGADPRFPRQWEGFGEDPYIGSEMGVQMVKGYEGQDNTVGDYDKVASCMKHFLGYGAPTSGKDRTPAFIPDDVLREYHLPAFKAAIEAGSHSIMINSGIINNIPVHSNYNLLTKLLKEELGFKGLVVTDWGDIENLHRRDHIAKDDKEAIMLAINAGIDMSMIPYQYETFCNGLVELVKEGKVKQERIDDAVRRILKVKYALNLFDKPVTDSKDYPKFGSKEFEAASYQMASEAITLLKNEGNVLPLSKQTKVLVTGPNANSMRTLNGGWTYSWQGEKVEEFASKYNTILEAVQTKIGAANVNYVPGVSYKMDGKYYEEAADKMDEAAEAAKNADVVILCLGENSYTEKPGDLQDLNISDLQIELAKKVAAAGKPVILVLNEGRPRLISRFEPLMKAVLQTYLPGNFGGDALASILFGDVNPSGKLPYTYPRYANATIPYFHKLSEEQTKAEGVYNYEADFNPQYQFGFGLSYTTFNYANLKLNKTAITNSDELQVSIDVTNTGSREGKEVVQLFTSDLFASTTPDVKRLRRFEKLSLKPGETKTITFTLTVKDSAFVNHEGVWTTEDGDFDLMIGDQKVKFNVINGNKL